MFSKQTLTTLATLGLTAFAATTTQAGSLNVGFQQVLASEDFDGNNSVFGANGPARFFHISVNANNAGYGSYVGEDPSDNPVGSYTRTFDDPIVGWSFIGGGPNNVLTVNQNSGGVVTWTTTDTAFDSFLRGRPMLDAVTAEPDPEALDGADLFFGDAGCADCHSGPLLSDMEFHNIGVPQIGPGKDPATGLDEGRFLVTGDRADRFAFRTPPLRNVDLTGPYMHDGAFATLEEVIRHHADPEASLRGFAPRPASAGGRGGRRARSARAARRRR